MHLLSKWILTSTVNITGHFEAFPAVVCTATDSQT